MGFDDGTRNPLSAGSTTFGVPGEGRGDQALSYHHALRAVGEILDSHGAEDVTILEAPEGMDLRFSVGGELRVLPVTWPQLAHTAEQHRVKRGEGAEPSRTSHEDLLRALGRELDELYAEAVLLEQVNERYLVTYQFRDPQESFSWRKRHLVLDSYALAKLLDDARGRRVTEPPPATQGRPSRFRKFRRS